MRKLVGSVSNGIVASRERRRECQKSIQIHHVHTMTSKLDVSFDLSNNHLPGSFLL